MFDEKSAQLLVTGINGVISIIDYFAQSKQVDGASLTSLLEARSKLTEVVIETQGRINQKGEDFQREEAARNS